MAVLDRLEPNVEANSVHPNPFADPEIAGSYEGWYEKVGRRSANQERALIRRLLARFPRARTILEPGCGTGFFTRWFGEQGLIPVGVWSDLDEEKDMNQNTDVLRIDLARCTGCGQCLKVCPVGAISLVNSKASINSDTCILCGACLYACPRAAISETRLPQTAIIPAIQPSEIQPSRIETSKPIPAAKSTGRLAWTIPVITYVGKEILPRLADRFLDLLDRHIINSEKDMRPSAVGAIHGEWGQGRRMRRRRGRNRM